MFKPYKHDLNCQYKTAFVLAHKLREAIAPIKEPRASAN